MTEKQVNAGYVIKDITIKSYDKDAWFLAPTWDLVNKYKSGKISEQEYTNDYNELVKRRYKFLFNSDIQKLNNNLILMCYCPSGSFATDIWPPNFYKVKEGYIMANTNNKIKIRIPIPPPGKDHGDKTKYNRKKKHKEKYDTITKN